VRRKSNKGFTLLLALVAIMLVGTALVVLSQIGQDMCFEADKEHAQAQARSLTASALAWSIANPQKLSAAGKNGIRLTVEGCKDGSVELTPMKVTDRGTEVKVTVHCHSGKNRINCTQTYDLPSQRRPGE
jgi:Tfp pilus assembly protein PilV